MENVCTSETVKQLSVIVLYILILMFYLLQILTYITSIVCERLCP
jgi:hypothetical protein